MHDPRNPDIDRILRLVGAIVLVSQEAERCLKVAIPFFASDDPSLEAALRRAERLRKRALGDLTGQFVAASTSDSPYFADEFARIVSARNQVVHHFDETYGNQLSANKHADVIAALEGVLNDLRGYRDLAQQLALVVLEGLRDTTFVGTPEHAEIASQCSAFKARSAR